MALSIETNEISDSEIRKQVESVILGCIGERPKEEDWKVRICRVAGLCEVTVKGPVQTRRRLFYDENHMLPKKIRDWLELYPLA